MPEKEEISADEVALYDRQIRLWGLEAQNRMRNSKILIVNLGALAAEVAKNIVLAGIGSLVVLDNKTVDAQDLGANFFLEESDIKSNRGEACLPRIRKLNPRVEVSAVSQDVTSTDPEWFGQFDIVVATELNYNDLVHVNTATRKSNTKLYAGGLMGLYGYVFADLVEHQFKIERDKPNVVTKIGPETDTRSIVSSSVRKDGHRHIETVVKAEKYKPLEECITSSVGGKFGSQFKTRQLLKVPPLLPGLLALWEVEKASQPLSALDKAAITQAAAQLGVPEGVITDDFLNCFSVGSEVSPVAAVVGGVLGQDVLNVLGQKEQPIQNLFIFDGQTNDGPIYAL
ncbi:DNA damage tolerance protein RHC31 [Trichomonascus vanleenenianus]|uniref:E1 ubiquitin-activating protein AOS1 n=1 Tax=Trichomonascus vanleenenianus TaxID=2268995 RepID=UPI003ECAF526